jgi:hypothetical protein
MPRTSVSPAGGGICEPTEVCLCDKSFLGVSFGNGSAFSVHARLKRSEQESPEDTCNSEQAEVYKTAYCGAKSKCLIFSTKE